MDGTVLSRARLAGAYLQGAAMVSAVLSKADLTGAHLGGADLRNAKVTTEQLAKAFLDEHTVLSRKLRAELDAYLQQQEAVDVPPSTT
jgi:uncharacterized protein YjbI with pentapeptide repeats